MGNIFSIDPEMFKDITATIGTEEAQSQLDHASSELYKLYASLINAGFNEVQAMSIVMALVSSIVKTAK